MLEGVLIGAILGLGAGILLWAGQRREMRKLFDRLEAMLDAAQNQTFDERAFDESRLSALETRWKQYLARCQVSEQNLTQEKAQIKTLIADISHQTKTPIANMVLYAELLAEQPLNQEGEVCVRALNEQAEKLRFLIEALVKMSRLETGIIVVQPKSCPAELLLEQVWAQIKPQAEAKGIQLDKPTAEGLLCCDLRWSVEALYNICDNAVKYAPSQTKVTITAQPYELFYRIDIADEGPGIAEEERGKIFGRFYRGQGKNGADGVGIGLYLTREILEAQGGYIKVASQLGEGSVFSVFLPREAAQ